MFLDSVALASVGTVFPTGDPTSVPALGGLLRFGYAVVLLTGFVPRSVVPADGGAADTRFAGGSDATVSDEDAVVRATHD